MFITLTNKANMAEPLKLYISIPSKAELQEDVQEMQKYAKEHPDEAAYFNTKEEIFEKELAVLNDPRNADVNPNTLAGAENLFNQIQQATKGLNQEAEDFLRADPSLIKYGWSMLPRHWIPV